MGKDIGVECLHENLKAKMQEATERGIIFEPGRYWCKLCNRYIKLEKLLPEKELLKIMNDAANRKSSWEDGKAAARELGIRMLKEAKK